MQNKNKIYAGILIILVLLVLTFLIAIPKKTTVYIRDNIKIQTSDGVVEYSILDPIEIVKDNKKDEWPIYDGIKKIGFIKSSDVVFYGTAEYDKSQNIKDERDRKAAELERKKTEMARIRVEQAKKKELAELERMVKSAFYNVSLENYSDSLLSNYQFFVDPIAWNSFSYSQQKNIFAACVRYVELKCNVDNDKAMRRTKIVNAYTGKTLVTILNYM